jgi:hypothetical protein
MSFCKRARGGKRGDYENPQMLELIPHRNSFIREAASSRVAEILEA